MPFQAYDGNAQALLTGYLASALHRLEQNRPTPFTTEQKTTAINALASGLMSAFELGEREPEKLIEAGFERLFPR